LSFEEHFGVGPSAIAEAPGRVNLIGEHTDYNGGLVLPAALELRTRVELRYREDLRIRGFSRECGAAEAAFDDAAGESWLDYARGTARALHEAGRLPAAGFDLYVESDVPRGAGLSSSAALEVAVALALAAAAGTPVRPGERLELARLCQRAEGGFVGVPCGIMDQFASACAREGHALLLDCRSLEWKEVPVPESLAILLVDTGVARELRGGAYELRRRECEAALQGARARLGRPLANLSQVRADDLRGLEPALDPVCLRRLRHVVTENARVAQFAAALRDGDLREAGLVLYASHESLSLDYEVSCPESDVLVADSRGLDGVIGARMTGAGWGGCTLHLVAADRAEACGEALAERFRSRFGRRPRVWRSRPARGAVSIRS
jgi:galactokinase